MKNNITRRDNIPITTLAQPRPAAVAGHPVMVGDIDSIVAQQRPSLPLYVIRPDVLAATARDFVRQFPGTPMFAVKCNPDRLVLQTLWRNGVKSFDAASIEEVRLVRKMFPKATIYFMHPVKAPEAIAEAYNVHGVRAFVLDTEGELHKILKATQLAADLELFVRLALPKNDKALVDFSGKFGAMPDMAVTLLQKCRTVGARVGVSFHVGTQSLEPQVYDRAVAWAADIIRRSGVTIDALDVGGGFPVQYPDSNPPPLSDFMDAIRAAVAAHGLSGVPLLAEPGRALVATCGSLVVRVEQRRGDMLYLNDGVYGGMLDAGPLLRMRFPVRVIRKGGKGPANTAYSFAGPTCDSVDMMPGPFMLPADMAEGQWIEVDCMGAYSGCVRTDFNGFGKAQTIALYDQLPGVAAKKTAVKTKN